MRATGLTKSPATLRLGRFADRRATIDLPAIQWALAMAAGIIIGEMAPWGVGTWTMVLVCAAVVAVLAGENRICVAATVCAVVAAMAIWSDTSQTVGAKSPIAEWATDQWQPVVLRANVANGAELRPNALARLRGGDDQPQYQSVMELTVTAMRRGEDWISSGGRVRAVVAGDVTNLLAGDFVTVYGHMQRIGPPTNPGAADMREVFAAQQIYVRLQVNSPQQMTLDRPGRWGPRRLISAVALHGDRALRKYVGEDSGPLASAMALGRRRAVDPEIQDRLVETGTVHLLSVSGMHLGMVALAVTFLVLLTGWSHGWRVVIVIAVCVFYAALTGAQPPVLRAAMLVAALMLGAWAGKRPDPLNSLALAAMVLLVINPSNLWQTGTQLSFVAVATIVVFGRRASGLFADDPSLALLVRSTRHWSVNQASNLGRRIVQMFVISFWVWVTTAPLVWQGYHILSPVSVLANVLMALPLTAALLLGVLTCTVAILAGPAAAPLGWLCRGSIEVMGWIVDLCAAIPCGHVWFPSPPWWWVMVFYAGLAIALLVPQRWLPQRQWRGSLLWGGIALWFVAAFFFATYPLRPLPRGSMALTFVDVGHGTSVLVETADPGGRWLYDAGRLGDPVWSASPIQDVLWSQGIWSLDMIAVSHADADHYNAIPDLLRRFVVDRIVVTPGLLDEDQHGLDPVRAAIHRSGVNVAEIHSGQTLKDQHGAPLASVLHPAADGPYASSDNARSLVLVIDHHGTSLVLPGDLEMPGTEHVIRQPRPAAGGVLMAPHHGSLQQDSRPMLDWARPATVIISGGDRANRLEVRQMWAHKGADVYITAAVGAIRIEVDAEGRATVWTWQNGEWGMGNGEWGMGNGEWGMGNGEWGMEGMGGMEGMEGMEGMRESEDWKSEI